MKTIEAIGEDGLISRLAAHMRVDKSVVKGIGDDCAVIDIGKEYLLLTCDMMVEGVDFTGSADPYLVGRKALAISASDIASCGGLPRYCMVSLGLPRRFPLGSVDRFYKGMRDLARRFKVNIVGGDMSKAPRFTVDVSLAGTVEKKNLVLRNGARPGDVVFVTGSFGGSIKGKHLKFTPRVEEARYLVTRYRPTAMIDASDGLCRDLYHILDESRVSAVLHEDLIPQSRASSGLADALYSGEDFELIFTAARKDAARIAATKRFRFYPVGTILPAGDGLLLAGRSGKPRRLEKRGYSHF
jgi:thiamine-monophosphate kinase